MSTASACANIALVKYWGKQAGTPNLPARGSLAMTLDALRTVTEVELVDGPDDQLIINGERVDSTRVSAFLDLVRAQAEPALSGRRSRVTSKSTFPVAAGLASSASGFAALAVAGADAYGLSLDAQALSRLARVGSGSAARSIHGGFVRLDVDESETTAVSLSSRMELCAVVAVARAGEKEVSSRKGMEHTRLTSPYHQAWLDTVDPDLEACSKALAEGDFEQLAQVVEGSCLAMHADAMAARPGLIYFQGVTLWAIEQVRKLRKQGVEVTFTIDAGPHLVALTYPKHLGRVCAALEAHADVQTCMTASLGGPAQVISPES